MDLAIDRSNPVPLYLQISQRIREQILAGRLPEGYQLPAERRLARALGVTRTTILAAYRELKSDALVDAHVGRGTVVVPRRYAAAPAPSVHPLAWDQLAREGLGPGQDPLVRDLLALTERRDVITLSVGLPAADLLPMDRVRELQTALLDEMGSSLLLHSPTEGVSTFRETLAGLATTRGIECSPNEVLVTSGSQQALDLVARTFLAPGDTVVVEEPTFFGALQVFRSAHARVLGVPTDADGMRTDVLESLLARHRPKLIYTLPTFGNPTGAVLSSQRRQHLVELATRFQVPVVEDDSYSELRYDGDAVPPLKALDRFGHVVYLSSFSKVLFPGLRVGWLVAPRAAIRRLALIKQAVDLHTTTPGQWILDRFIRSGDFRRHVARCRQAYALRRDTMDSALRAAAGGDLTWQTPAGGFYLWARLHRKVPQGALLARAADQCVSYLPGTACFVNDPGESYLRLNFTYPTPEQIKEGVRRLVEALRQVSDEPGARVSGGEAGGTPPIV